MLAQLNKKLWDWLTVWNAFLAKTERAAALQRNQHRLLVFCHGYSLAHVIRPLVVARALRQRGYEVVFAGRGPQLRTKASRSTTSKPCRNSAWTNT